MSGNVFVSLYREKKPIMKKILFFIAAIVLLASCGTAKKTVEPIADSDYVAVGHGVAADKNLAKTLADVAALAEMSRMVGVDVSELTEIINKQNTTYAKGKDRVSESTSVKDGQVIRSRNYLSGMEWEYTTFTRENGKWVAMRTLRLSRADADALRGANDGDEDFISKVTQ